MRIINQSVVSGLPNRTDSLLPPVWGSNKGFPPQHATCGGEAGQSWIPTFYTLRQLHNVTVPSTIPSTYICEQSVNQLSICLPHVAYITLHLAMLSTDYVFLRPGTVAR